MHRAVSTAEISKPREQAAKAQALYTQVLKHFDRNFDNWDDAAEQLSSPDKLFEIPFPYAGAHRPKRFKEGHTTKNSYRYMGREIFGKLLDSVMDAIEGSKTLDLWVYGPIGYGKSHLLATMVYYLTCRRRKVIYLPDCRICEHMHVSYVLTAMFFAWANDQEKLEKIILLETEKDIQRFLNTDTDDVVFIIDQVNALDEENKTDMTNKSTVRNWLNKCRGESRTLLSTSANNVSFMRTPHQQDNHDVIHVYGGFNDVSLNSCQHYNFLLFCVSFKSNNVYLG